MNWLIFISTIIFILSINPSFAQESNARVINQSANGLAYPSSSYIGSGTLSKTAQQGAGLNPQNGPGLPKVNHGGYFGTPGDNLYSDNPDLVRRPQQGARVQRPTRIIYKQVPQTPPKVYVPDPNIPMNYSDYKPEPTPGEDNNIAPQQQRR